MASADYVNAQLEKNIDRLRDNKCALNFNLNLLYRSDCKPSTHLTTIDALALQLIHLEARLYNLEMNIKNRMQGSEEDDDNEDEGYDEDYMYYNELEDEEYRDIDQACVDDLKASKRLMASFESLSREMIRLEITMERKHKAAVTHQSAKRARVAVSINNETPFKKRRCFNLIATPSSSPARPKIKEEEEEEEEQSIPAGYHWVRAHLRKNPVRKRVQL